MKPGIMFGHVYNLSFKDSALRRVRLISAHASLFIAGLYLLARPVTISDL